MRKLTFISLPFLWSCFLPFIGGGGDQEPQFEPEIIAEQELTQEPFIFEVDTIQAPTPPPQQIPQQEPIELQPISRVKLWPRDEDIPLAIDNIAKLDQAGRRARYEIEMQWRQICDDRDTEWYEMKMKHGIQTDDDYVFIKGLTLDAADTVIVLSSVMREIDPVGQCNFAFRCRMKVGRRVSKNWTELPRQYRLVDPLLLQVLSEPNIRPIED